MSTSLLHQELSTEKGQSCPPIPDSNPLNPKSPALRTTSNSTILNSPIETINVNTSSKSNISGESTINGSAYSNSTTVVQPEVFGEAHTTTLTHNSASTRTERNEFPNSHLHQHQQESRNNGESNTPMTSPKHFPTDDLRHSLFYKAGSAAHHKSATSSKQSSTTSLKDGLNNANTYHFQNTFLDNNVMSDLEESPVPNERNPIQDTGLGPRSHATKFGVQSTTSLPTTILQSRLPNSNKSSFFPFKSYTSSPVKETKHVFLEYDPMTRRKVLNTYEILREIGKGEHGKVKLARDLINNELVAIKIVNRKSRKERPSLRMRKNSSAPVINEYELKVKREIAIMKKCRHKHIVALREVLDDLNSLKIYLVLEYMEKGEIKWKKLQSDVAKPTANKCYDANDNEIPCCGNGRMQQRQQSLLTDEDLLSNEFSPNLTFKQSRKIFRDVLLGLEYLHMQGIVHRDIKPANLLVSADNIVKISDFGVSFATSLAENDEGYLVNELDLAKTAGTPAFFAPELCQFDDETATEKLSSSTESMTPPKIDYKIDIWALGVTLYCLLFGKVPFNADTEYDLFQVIVKEPLKFPNSIKAFNPPATVTEEEFELAKDLLSKMLDKNNRTRIEIQDIKVHPFTLMDLDNDVDGLHELFHLNGDNPVEPLSFDLDEHDIVLKDEVDNAVIGVGARIKRSLVRAIRAGGLKDGEIRNKFAALQLEHSRSENSEESSSGYSNYSSSTRLLGYQNGQNYSMILSEGLPVSSATPPPALLAAQQKRSSLLLPKSGGISEKNNPHFPSSLAHQIPNTSSPSTCSSSTSMAFQNHFSFAGMRESGKSLLHDMIESNSNNSSRRGSSAGITVSEAPQIETKRNVGGDLYLKNQSVVETFKGIQLQDDKRRRSSIFSLHSQIGTNSNKSSLSHELTPTQTGLGASTQQQHQHYSTNYSNIAAPIPVPAPRKQSTSDNEQDIKAPLLHQEKNVMGKPYLKIGPISIAREDEKSADDHPDSSIISLPLSESFASLDSINDDYLSRKYEEYTNNRKENSKSEGNVPVILLRRKSSLSESDLTRHVQLKDPFGKFKPDGSEIAEKFKAFNLGNLMKTGGKFALAEHNSSDSQQIKGNNYQSSDDGIAPKAIVPAISYSSSDSYSSCSSSSFDDEDESDDDEENLTLAFQSKVAPISRANFLSLTGRAKSHDSNLPTLRQNREKGRQLNPEFQGPIIFHDGLPEFEDVPDGLINSNPIGNNNVNGNSAFNSGYSYYDNVNPTVVSSNVSTATLTMGMAPSESVETNVEAPAQENAVKVSSPLNPHKNTLSRSDVLKDLKKNTSISFGEILFNDQFNNHYKKDPVYSPFPSAKHLDNDQETIVKESASKFHEHRPTYYISNSVTIGLLHRSTHREDDDDVLQTGNDLEQLITKEKQG